MTQEEASRKNAFGMDRLVIKAAEDALFYTFQIGYEESNDGSKNSPFYFVVMVLTEMT